MEATWKPIFSIGRIAKQLNEPLHRVQYAIRTRSIKPGAMAGNARVFDEADIERIADALRDIDAKKGIIGRSKVEPAGV